MSTEGETVREEGSLWNRLSPELQDRVLAFLPVLTFLKLRTVCKRWAALPSSQGFRNLCMLVSPRPAYLLVCRRAHTFCVAYDESLNEWYDLDLRFLDRLCLPHWKSPTGDVYHSIEAASGGLFFIWSHKSDGDPSLYSVCNPVTRTWRKLPSLPYYIVPLAVAMVTDSRTLAYKIFVAADSAPETFLSPMAMQAHPSHALVESILNSALEPYVSLCILGCICIPLRARMLLSWGWACMFPCILFPDNPSLTKSVWHGELDRLQVYDSTTQCWKRLRLMPPFLDIVWSSAICNEIMYVLSFDPCDLWSYDLSQDVWNKVEIQVPYSLSMTLLVSCGGTLYLVGEVRGRSPRCISIWQFNMAARTCLEIESQIPQSVFEDFATDETYGMWSAIGHNTGIAFKNGVVRTLMYDVARHSVHWLPDCQGDFEYDNGYSVYGHSTSLSFAATV